MWKAVVDFVVRKSLGKAQKTFTFTSMFDIFGAKWWQVLGKQNIGILKGGWKLSQVSVMATNDDWKSKIAIDFEKKFNFLNNFFSISVINFQ